MAVNEHGIPDDLRRKVPPMTVMHVDQHTFWTVFGLGLAVLSLHGPVVGRPDYNGLRFLVGSWLCPAIAAACDLLWPYNPYRSTWARFASMTDRDRVDADAERLVQLFRSQAARRFLFRTTVKTSSVLFVAMTMLAVLHWKSLTWTFVSPWLGQGLIGGFFGALIAVNTELVSWGLKRWAAAIVAGRSN